MANWKWVKKKSAVKPEVIPIYPCFSSRLNESDGRITWNQYFMGIAEKVSTRSTCDRKHVGCVLVKDNRILSSGYNGSMTNSDHCDNVGHLMENDHCVRTVHAEVNAITQCAKFGVSCNGAACYCNTFPCWNCFKTLVNAGISVIFYKDVYPAEGKNKVLEFAKELSIPIVRLT